MLRPTGISDVNVGGITIHSALGIKLGIKLMALSDKAKAILQSKLSEVKMFVLDKVLMVSRDLFFKTHANILEVCKSHTPIPFAGLSIVVSDDF